MDEEENLTDLRRMGNVCLEAMNSVAEDLPFTVESQEDFRIQGYKHLISKHGLMKMKMKHNAFEKKMQTTRLDTRRR